MPAGKVADNWLYKQDDLLLGPVPYQKIVELLYSGAIDRTTPVSPHGGQLEFKPLGELEAFRIHLAKAQAKLKVEAQHQEQKRTFRRRGLVKISLFALLALALLFSGGRLAVWLAVHRPWESRIQMPEPVITDEMPTITLASAREEEELAYPIGTGKPLASATPGSGSTATPGKPGLSAQPGTPAKPARPASKPRPGKPAAGIASRQPDSDDVECLQMWDQSAINTVVAANKKSLHPCLSAEASRQKPGWSARIPLEFTIGNDGRVTKLWIDNPEFKSEQSELFRCMLTELRKWRFPAYEGEQTNVSLAFSIAGR
jgi:hypothetical protein